MTIQSDIAEVKEVRSSVYGPVHSWRVGSSLGIDLLLETSTCSFNCIYCQLGDIQLKTAERKIYVPTAQLEHDLRRSRWEEADIITLSGSGEPTLAQNLGEAIHLIKEYTHKPVMVLTNATLLDDPAVVQDLQEADIVTCKLDAATEEGLKQMNRPVAGVTLAGIISGIKNLRANYSGKVALQCMFMPTNRREVEALAEIINALHPDEVQLNTPKRPYPLAWNIASRGNHPKDHAEAEEVPARQLRTVSPLEADEIEEILRRKTDVPILSIYKK
ncbi:MAG TPA: radical SAM protein [Coleofasciculaceae cyanobacterium]|jgi:wyosine [tRNA(Phe)-imidazoG37] synthetase (radical SAM superfamily)